MISLTLPGPAGEDDDAVGQIDRLVDLVGDEQHGLSGFRPDLQQLLLHRFAGLRVERCERLVHQQDLRVHDQRAREIDALLHAAGELVGIMVLEAGEADHVDEMRRARPSPRACRRRGIRGRRRTLPSTVRHGSSDASWNTTARSGPGLVTTLPSTRMRPALAAMRPSTTDRNVVLPQPDGPTIETNSPSITLQVYAVERGQPRVGARLEIVQPDVLCFELGSHDRLPFGHAGGRQASTRRSMRCTISTSIIPAATMVSTPTNTLSVWKREPAWLIMAPMPAAEP